MCIGGNQAFGITHTINFKTMTTFNTDYNNTELLDQELTTSQLIAITGGIPNLGDKIYPKGYNGPRLSDSPAEVARIAGKPNKPLEVIEATIGKLPTPANLGVQGVRTVLKIFGL